MKMTKRVLSLVLVLVFTASLAGIAASAYDSDDFIVYNGVLTAYNGPAGDVILPADLGITEIGENAFLGSDLSSVTIPAGVTDIGAKAFGDCICLKSIAIPDSLKTIGENAFNGCQSLEAVILPKGLSKIDSMAFAGCASLKSVNIHNDNITLGSAVFYNSGLEDPLFINGGSTLCYVPASYTSYKLPDTVKTINGGCFSHNTRITEVIIPSSVTAIGSEAFSWCINLASIKLPDSITSIGYSAFEACLNIKSINIPKNLTSLGSNVFNLSGIEKPMFSYDGKVLYFVPSNTTVFKVPEGVTKIHAGAFLNLYKMTSVTLPEGLTEIGDYSFSACSALKELYIPESVTTIGEYAFCNCNALSSVNLPNNINVISQGMFSCCTSLKSITIPQSVISIGNRAFSHCGSLSSLTIPKSVTTIGEYAFTNCSALKSVKMPSSLSFISIGMFLNCTSLKSITIPDSVDSIGSLAFSGCSSLASVIVPDTVSSIGASVFVGTDINTPIYVAGRSVLCYVPPVCKDFAIPNTVTVIGGGAFYNCSGLTSINIPDSVKSISDYAFASCKGLTTISLPESVTAIGDNTFGGCLSLTAVMIPQSVISIDKNAFNNSLSVRIYGAKGSCAEGYALKNKIPFSPVMRLAYPTSSKIMIDEKAVKLEAYNIGNNSYFKLRDVAMLLSGTKKQFNVTWNADLNAVELISGKAYSPIGGEFVVSDSTQNTSILSAPLVRLDGKQISLKAYEIDGCNYVKLRDLAAVINFGVTYDAANDSIAINTAVGYTA